MERLERSGSSRSDRSSLDSVAEYESGEFYRRELPCILRLLEEHALTPETIVVDGHVYLDGHSRPGLGKHLFDHLGGALEVIGVAKNTVVGMAEEYELRRGRSRRPLYVTSVGVELTEARRRIGSMSGAYRIPDLLKQVDRLCREPGPR